jgi:hypothetical protein
VGGFCFVMKNKNSAYNNPKFYVNPVEIKGNFVALQLLN